MAERISNVLLPEILITARAPPVGVAKAQMVSFVILSSFHEYKIHGTNEAKKGSKVVPM